MKKILVTGSTGFIGSCFVKLYQHEYSIQTFSFLKDDIKTLHVKDIDVIIHLSALVHQPKAHESLYKTVNIDSTILLAKKAKEEGVGHFVFMSTIAVYDENLNVLTEDSPCTPTSFYGKSKHDAEKQLMGLADENFKVSIIRPPMVYGFGAPGNIQSLMQLIKKLPILPFGRIINRRSFVYVGNLCALVDRIIKMGKAGIFLASDDRALSTTELIKLIVLAMPKKVYLLGIPLFPIFLKWFKPLLYKRLFESLEVDNTQTKKVLGFTNPYSVEEGIQMMVNGKLK